MAVINEELWKAIDDLKLAFSATLFTIGRALEDRVEKKQLPNDRFQKKEDCYLDNKTGLEWSLETYDQMPWKEAIEFCRSLGDGWRLPTIEELLTLVDYSRTNPASVLPYMVSSYYWSSTTGAGDTDGAWYVDFDYGYDGWDDKSGNHYVRAVRGRPLKYEV